LEEYCRGLDKGDLGKRRIPDKEHRKHGELQLMSLMPPDPPPKIEYGVSLDSKMIGMHKPLQMIYDREFRGGSQ